MPAVAPVALMDLDGTLTDHAAALAQWSAEFAAKHGIPVSRIRGIAEQYAYRHDVLRALRDELRLSTSVLDLLQEYRMRSAELVPVRPKVCAALRQLADAGWRLGVVTNGAPGPQRLKLEVAELSDCFDVIVISGACGLRKPHRAIFELALDALDADASMAVMVGDDLRTDIKGGTAAGMNTIWVSGQRTRTAQDPAPTHTTTTTVDAIEALRCGRVAPKALTTPA
ncbi:HAD family hydrolase [Streptomyces sp. NPDC053474]|uniref:HAD family hydrolase n=1 Tax=Streptomyces sp. NPDC053474 TaxID=3365704 RepID=UPI0037D4F669